LNTYKQNFEHTHIHNLPPRYISYVTLEQFTNSYYGIQKKILIKFLMYHDWNHNSFCNRHTQF